MKPQAFDVDALRRSLRPLDLSLPFAPSDEQQAYLDFYRIDFTRQFEDVQHYFGSIDCDRYQVACHYFAKANAERTCFVVHGYMDHSALYRKMINYLLCRGCNVIAIDLPGHGLSSGTPATISSFGDYVLVLRQCLEFFYRRVTTPWHVVAQSMGGAITMDYLLSQQYDEKTGPFDRVLLLAPLVRPKGWTGMRFAHWALKGIVKHVRRNFSNNSHDPDFVDFLKQRDPLQVRKIPVAWVTAMLRWERRFRDLSWSDLEVLVVQGEGDATVDWEYNLGQIADKFPRAKFMRINDARHHLVGESDEYFDRVTQAADIYFERRQHPRD